MEWSDRVSCSFIDFMTKNGFRNKSHALMYMLDRYVFLAVYPFLCGI